MAKATVLTEQQKSVKVGDMMIWDQESRYNFPMPVQVQVIAVTPKGWVRILVPRATPYQAAFKPLAWREDGFEEVGDNKSKLYVYSEKRWNGLVGAAEAAKQRQEEKRKQEEQRRLEAELRYKQEINDIKAVCGNVLPIDNERELPDGSKLFTLTVPLKENLVEQKQFCVAIARLKLEEGWEGEDFKMKKRLALYLTYCTRAGGSFPSCSGNRFDTETDALWEVCRYCHTDRLVAGVAEKGGFEK